MMTHLHFSPLFRKHNIVNECQTETNHIHDLVSATIYQRAALRRRLDKFHTLHSFKIEYNGHSILMGTSEVQRSVILRMKFYSKTGTILCFLILSSGETKIPV